MPVITVGTQTCYLISYDKEGLLLPSFVEATDASAQSASHLLSDDVVAQLSNAANGYTDVFVFSHGFFNSLSDCEASYSNWIAAMADPSLATDIAAMGPKFKPLLIGLHWPSISAILPNWIANGSTALQTMSDDDAVTSLVSDADQRPLGVKAAQLLLPLARSGATMDAATRQSVAQALAAAYQEVRQLRGDTSTSDAPCSGEWWLDLALDIWDGVKLLVMLALFDFIIMYGWAQIFGGYSARPLAQRLMNAAAGNGVRFHAMGHSLGTGVVSAMIGASPYIAQLPQPFRAVYLVEAAIPRWSYSNDITINDDIPGIFSANLAPACMTGPLLTTQSKNDWLVLGTLYLIAATVAGWDGTPDGEESHLATGDNEALGFAGITGALAAPWTEAIARTMPPASDVSATSTYAQGQAYNLDGTAYISGHSDFANPNVAHAFWRAIQATL